jgi:hypothetical protein
MRAAISGICINTRLFGRPCCIALQVTFLIVFRHSNVQSKHWRAGACCSYFCWLAGLGGIAAGGGLGAMGIPGFQQNVITDPEYPGSSNTSMARASTPTLRYLG